MKKHILTLIGLASCALAFSPASYAGATNPVPVLVDFDRLLAYGDLNTARHDDAPNVYIGCGSRRILSDDGSITDLGFCQAEDADKNRVFCITNDPGLIDAISFINDSSFITFSFDKNDEGFICRQIGSSTQSVYLP